MVLIEAISRLRKNILGNQESAKQETFSHNGILEYPQYTRPLEFRGQRVPEVLGEGSARGPGVQIYRHDDLRGGLGRALVELRN